MGRSLKLMCPSAAERKHYHNGCLLVVAWSRDGVTSGGISPSLKVHDKDVGFFDNISAAKSKELLHQSQKGKVMRIILDDFGSNCVKIFRKSDSSTLCFDMYESCSDNNIGLVNTSDL